MGRPRKHFDTFESIQELTQAQLVEAARLLVTGNLKALMAIKDDPNATPLKVWFASVAAKAISKGDMPALQSLLDRIIGKVSSPIEVVATTVAAEPEISPEARNARIKELEELDKLLGDD
jgi:hypothetical protein